MNRLWTNQEFCFRTLSEGDESCSWPTPEEMEQMSKEVEMEQMMAKEMRQVVKEEEDQTARDIP